MSILFCPSTRKIRLSTLCAGETITTKLPPHARCVHHQNLGSRFKERYHVEELLQGKLIFRVVGLEPPSKHEYLH
jgi:hypothetical protein